MANLVSEDGFVTDEDAKTVIACAGVASGKDEALDAPIEIAHLLREMVSKKEYLAIRHVFAEGDQVDLVVHAAKSSVRFPDRCGVEHADFHAAMNGHRLASDVAGDDRSMR